MAYNIQPVILCGGSGTRLWPLSTPQRPKQFLALTSSKSMIEETADRFKTSHAAGVRFSTPLVVGSKRHERLLTEKLADARKILEPFGRNSAPAVAAACLACAPGDLILILPADHDIRDIQAFHAAIAVAAEPARSGAIATFGIEPTYASTSYGYIKAVTDTEQAPFVVERFVEKPALEDAESYLASGSYFWNAGIFMFRADTMIAALRVHAPDVLSGVEAAMSAGADEKIIHLDPSVFAQTPNIAIDYAVMEKASNVTTVPVTMGWSDVGGYRALHELLTSQAEDNYTNGPVLVQNSSGLYVRSEGPAISVNGVSDLVIVATDDEVMITPKDEDAAVKELGKAVQVGRSALGFSPELIERAQAWLFTAFRIWADKAWAADDGGFVERLNMDGAPDLQANRRVRVQARQVFSFAKAIEMGWPEVDIAAARMQQGIDFIDKKLRHPDGGWVHVFAPDGTILDAQRDLYDHAFIILAGAAAYQVSGSERALQLADDAMAFIDSALKDPVNGGWREGISAALPRRANPHMHLLEAMLAYHAATYCEQALVRASEVVRLFEVHFFQPATDVMAEFFAENWRLESGEQTTIFEPGHHYEWANLLCKYEQATGHDTLSWRRRLIRRADQTGLNPQTGFAVNALQAGGSITDHNSRLWHQLEMFRAYLLHPSVAAISRSEILLQKIFETYLDQGPEGGWIDEINPDGSPKSDSVPASMLYHAVTAFSELV